MGLSWRKQVHVGALPSVRPGGAQVHHDGLVDLLPQVRAHDLDERDLQRRNLACAVEQVLWQGASKHSGLGQV